MQAKPLIFVQYSVKPSIHLKVSETVFWFIIKRFKNKSVHSFQIMVSEYFFCNF